ncbi:MAG: hypothetical protein HUU01_00190 [Saprospiraceae bacterium]|nr:hypothetical protein [Saprospiraceae bacterium]
MIFIKKNPEPPGLKQYKSDIKHLGRTPLWEQFSGENSDRTYESAFEELRISLVKEQRSVCCYCQQKIAFKSAETGKLLMKTEHFLPKKGKHAVPDKQLDYGNLLAVCFGNSDTEQEKHCDSHKLGNILQAIPNPSEGKQKDFRPFLKYKVQINQQEVLVLPMRNDERLEDDINKVLNLNEQSLRSKRFSAWESVSRLIKKKDGTFKVQRIRELLEIYTPAEQKEYMPFCDFITSWLREHLREIEG